MPPIVIKVRDHRTFGRKPVVGRHVIKIADMVQPPKKEIALTKGKVFSYSAIYGGVL